MMIHNHILGAPTSSLSNPSGLQSAPLNDVAQYNNIQQQKEEIKTHFTTREGTYRIMTQAEFSRPSRVPKFQNVQAGLPSCSGASVRVSFLTIPGSPVKTVKNNENLPTYSPTTDTLSDPTPSTSDAEDFPERICFNIGRELYVYPYKGTQTTVDLNRPIDKRVYKGTFPTCHNFNQPTATKSSCSLIIGFSAGQIQLIDPCRKDYPSSRLYNEERFVDKTSVTCLKWVPGQSQHFLVSYSSGNMYLYNEELQCQQNVPSYQIFKQGDRFTIYTCKSKTTRNPVYRWAIGTGPVNQFAFSGPDAKMLATVSHDGYLRIFNYHEMELLCYMKSYFGGLLTVAWSPDAKIIATGGEDDLLTVYHVQDKRVVLRGQGHKSWISQVAFDSYASQMDEVSEVNGIVLDMCSEDGMSNSFNRDSDSAMTTPVMRHLRRQPQAMSSVSRCSVASFGTIGGACHGLWYRIGTVGHDTQLCLWDITEDMLKPHNVQRHRNSTILAPTGVLEIQTSTSRLDPLSEVSPLQLNNDKPKKKKFHRRGFTLGRIGGGASDRRRLESPLGMSNTQTIDEAKLLGTRICPRMEDVPVIEPLMCKKIAHERLTTLEFRHDSVITACQEGFICTWARPGKNAPIPRRNDINSPMASVSPSESREPKDPPPPVRFNNWHPT